MTFGIEMTDDVTILQQATQKASKSGAPQCGYHLLSPELLEKARSRVKLIAWIMFVTMAFGALFDFTYFGIVLGGLEPATVGGGVLMVALSAGLLLAAHSSRLKHVTVLHLALGYEVIACFFMAILMPLFMYRESGHLPYVTWVAPIIIMFPLIVPSPPRLTLISAIVAGSMRPLGLLFLKTFTDVQVGPLDLLFSCMSPAFAVGIAYAGSRVVHGMNVDLAKAQRMGSYQLQSRLGTGGMGEVWLGKHNLLARPAAVKLISPETLSQNTEIQRVALARFQREAQTTAAMRSPHTIEIYDFGIARTGAFYYVMEYLHGMDLEKLVKQFGPISPSRLVYLLRQVCDSLGEAHEKGLIHRDVKPANVFVCRYGRYDDFVKVLDFGLVKSDGENEDDIGLTAEGTVSGTAAFVAPEQAIGDTTDGRTDIYSLGCTAYWALTGSYVFQGKSAMATVMMHVNTTPDPPSASGIQHIPPELDDVVMACLEKDPANRPQNADALATMFDSCDCGVSWSRHLAREWWETNAPGTG